MDRAVAQLTHYGPAASEQIHHHLEAIRHLLALEHASFTVLEDGAPDVPQLPLPPGLADEDDTVISLTAERDRRART